MSHRLRGRFGYPEDEPFRVTLHPERLDEPTRWWKPQRIFVGSMTDIFHEEVPDAFLMTLFYRLASLPRHTFLLVTKRIQRARSFSPPWGAVPWPQNIWLGVTAENQAMADERIPVLLEVPAAVRFVSVEPMLEAVRLEPWLVKTAGFTETLPALDLVIAGPETGPSKRPCDPAWIEDLAVQCADQHVAFWDKRSDPIRRELPEVTS